MKIQILSDVVLNPLIKEFKTKEYEIEVSIEYFEDISLSLINYQFLSSNDFYFIHSDQLFHRKPIDWQLDLLDIILNITKNNPQIKFIISNNFSKGFSMTEVSKSAGDIFDIFKIFNEKFNQLLINSNIYVFDFIDIIFNIGLRNSYNYNLGFLYQMPYTGELIKVFSESLYQFIFFLKSEEKKVIILDCDNTLWGGIVGEDGISAIKCDKTYSGIVYYNFQLFLLELIKDGFVLCICSKNNSIDVENAFRELNMPLKWENFILKEINWEDKSININKIARELNVSESSFIFIDDNSFELEIVKNRTLVNTFFQQSDSYVNLLQIMKSNSFRRKRLTDEDRLKNEMYQKELIRKNLQNKSISKEEFIKNLGIEIQVEINNRENYNRLSQMTEKTNQFNFNKQILTENDFLKIEQNKGYIFSLKLFDKFGAYGIVGLAIIENDNNLFNLKNYLLSCRALGKNVEFIFFKYVIDHLKSLNIKLENIIFKFTDKNIPSQLFLKQIENEYRIKIIE